MATYTSKLRLALQAFGENPDSWGSTLNNAVFQLLEDALTGVVNIGAVGVKTLSSNNGATDEARCMFLNCTGNAGGSGLEIRVPANDKMYFVRNALDDTANDTVVVTTQSGPTVSVLRGQTTIVWARSGANGVTEISPTQSGTLATLTVSGNGTIAGSLAVGSLTVGGSNPFPPGIMLPYTASIAAPSGWLLCDGTAVSRATYSALNTLYAASGYPYGSGNGTTTFNVPDMRGYFARGLDTAVGTDPDFATRVLGSAQTDELKSHTHRPGQGSGGTNTNAIDTGSGFSGRDTFAGFTAATNLIEATGGAETRPKNKAFPYIVKT